MPSPTPSAASTASAATRTPSSTVSPTASLPVTTLPTPRPTGVATEVAWTNGGQWTHTPGAGVVTTGALMWSVGESDGRTALVRIGGRPADHGVLPLPVQPADGRVPLLIPTATGLTVIVQPDDTTVAALNYATSGATLVLRNTAKTTKDADQKITWGGADLLIQGTPSRATQTLSGSKWKPLPSADRWITVASTEGGKTRVQLRLSPGSSSAKFGKTAVQLDAAADTWEAIGTRDGVLMATHGPGRNSCEMYSWSGQKIAATECTKPLGNLVQSATAKVRSFGAVIVRGSALMTAPAGGEVTAVSDRAVYLDGNVSTEVPVGDGGLSEPRTLGVRVIGTARSVVVMEDAKNGVMTARVLG